MIGGLKVGRNNISCSLRDPQLWTTGTRYVMDTSHVISAKTWAHLFAQQTNKH
jgi:hypothetical protein